MPPVFVTMVEPAVTVMVPWFVRSAAVPTMQTRQELYDSIGYWDYERKLDELFARSK